MNWNDDDFLPHVEDDLRMEAFKVEFPIAFMVSIDPYLFVIAAALALFEWLDQRGKPARRQVIRPRRRTRRERR